MTLKCLLSKKLNSAASEKLVQGELEVIIRICQPRRVYLFGSASRGEMTEDSDLDILLVLPNGADMKAVKKAYYGRRRDHNFPVDIIFMEESDFETKSRIGGVSMICRNEGRLLYESPHD